MLISINIIKLTSNLICDITTNFVHNYDSRLKKDYDAWFAEFDMYINSQ